MSGWRSWALLLGLLVTAGGFFLMHAGGGPVILILGVVMFITAALEPLYGRARGAPRGGQWRPTEERFVDPETGKVVTVWFDPETGDRRYVDEEAKPPAA